MTHRIVFYLHQPLPPQKLGRKTKLASKSCQYYIRRRISVHPVISNNNSNTRIALFTLAPAAIAVSTRFVTVSRFPSTSEEFLD